MLTSSIIADLCIYILTWNVGDKNPGDISLTGALALNGTGACPDQRPPDIYVIGLQEVNTKPKSQLLAIWQDNPWVLKVRDHLDNSEYVKVDTEQLQGIVVMMFAQRQHIPHMKDIETENTRVGLGGLWGNKGAVSIRMSLYGTGVCFIVAHLAAHDHELRERIVDYNQIVSNHQFKTKKYTQIFDHDFVFWFGDLNFRLDVEDSAWDVRNMIEQGNYEHLVQRDQLLLVRKSGNAFALLNEQLPTFPPTFKFTVGTSDYDLKRRPAWCDRILYRVQENKYPNIMLNLTQLSYQSHGDYVLSDHKPVSATFLYRIASEQDTDEELYEMTHGGTAPPDLTPLATFERF